jgi:hypothetical protein
MILYIVEKKNELWRQKKDHEEQIVNIQAAQDEVIITGLFRFLMVEPIHQGSVI